MSTRESFWRGDRMKNRNIKMKNVYIILTFATMVMVMLLQWFYYARISSATEKVVHSLSNNVVEQVDKTLRHVLNQAEDVSTYLAYDSTIIENFMAIDDSFEMYKLKNYVDDIFSTTIRTNTDILDIVLLRRDGGQPYYSGQAGKVAYKALDSLRSRVASGEKLNGILYLGQMGSLKESYLAYATPAVYMSTGSRKGEFLGCVVVLLKADALPRIIEDVSLTMGSEFYVVDRYNIVVSNGGTTVKYKTYQDIKLDIKKRNVLVVEKEIGSTGLRIIAKIDQDGYIAEYSFFKSFTFLFAVIMLVLLGGLGLIFNINITVPVSRLNAEIENVTNDGIKKRIKMSYKGEIGSIASKINNMLDSHEVVSTRIIHTQQRLYEVELIKKQTELYALENQINPHFLFNTLQTICGIALEKNMLVIVEAASAMADIFKYSLKSGDKVTVRQEADIVVKYLKIVSLRFNSLINWEIDIPPEILEMKVMKMFLQPMVENAVYHGLERSKGGTLWISAKIDSGVLIFYLEDNGIGVEQETLRHLQNILGNLRELEAEGRCHKRIGIANVALRIKLLYGEEYGINIENRDRGGTLVAIRLPLAPPA